MNIHTQIDSQPRGKFLFHCYSRPKVRGMMIAVAVVALIVAPCRHWAYCRSQADRHEQRFQSIQELVTKADKASGYCLSWGFDGRSRTDYLREAIQHRKMAEAYEHAAFRPWLSLPPEPIESD